MSLFFYIISPALSILHPFLSPSCSTQALIKHVHILLTSEASGKLLKEAMKHPQAKGMLAEVGQLLEMNVGKPSRKDRIENWG